MNIYSEILSALEIEESVMLATIISTTGSTPASALSKMLVKNNGTKSVGSIGGGCMEGDVLTEAKRLFPLGKANILTFRLKEDEFIQGLICGGNLDVLIEPITRKRILLLQQINSLCESGRDCYIASFVLTDGTIKDKTTFATIEETNKWIDGILEKWGKDIRHPANTLLHLKSNQVYFGKLHQNEILRIKLPAGEIFVEPVQCSPSLYIFGGGHIAKSLCYSATECGFNVVVIDDREQYANSVRFPKAAQTLAIDFLSAFDHISVKSSSFIVITTRGHQYDEEILERALQTSASYIGMIGSRRKIETIYERLLKHGVPIAQLKRVHAPIGIELGAVTPEEIAISIVAQLIRIRHGMNGLSIDKSELMYSFFHKNDVSS